MASTTSPRFSCLRIFQNRAKDPKSKIGYIIPIRGTFRRTSSHAADKKNERNFSSETTLPGEERIEEETLPDHDRSIYYPAVVGQKLKDRYLIIGKLGFGAYSTVWLCRDTSTSKYVAIKIGIQRADREHPGGDQEVANYCRVDAIRGRTQHPGAAHVRSLIEAFVLPGVETGQQHVCLVHEPLWWDARQILELRAPHAKADEFVRGVIKPLLQALVFLHDECNLIHSDIKDSNVIMGLRAHDILHEFEMMEKKMPSGCKRIGGRVVYRSRALPFTPEFSNAVLCDLGSAVDGTKLHYGSVQPRIYRAPEVVLGAPWGYGIDIWSVGILAWEFMEGEHLFDGGRQTWSPERYLAQMVTLMGRPPVELLEQGANSEEWFDNHGNWRATSPLPIGRSFDALESQLEGDDRAGFLAFIRKMLRWDPEERMKPSELLQDPWLQGDDEDLALEGTSAVDMEDE